MKLLRYGKPGGERPGLMDADGVMRDLSGVVADIAGHALAPAALDKLQSVDPATLPVVGDDQRLGPCVGAVGRVVCIGLNYADHAAESGLEPPEKPVVFMKATKPSGANDPIIVPRGSRMTDWEVELGVIIGQRAQYVDVDDALDYVAGYCVCNDVSERQYQIHEGGQWTKGKSCDSFAPVGPWLVTADEIPNPQALDMWLEVNGKRYQDGATNTMIFTVADIVSHLSQFMTLYPGDVISTGTPPGVGMGQKPSPIYLKAGDVVRLGVEGLGEQEQVCVDWPG